MSRSSLSAFISLSASFIVLCYGQHTYESLASPRLITSDSFLSPDSRGDGSFAVADVKYYGSPSDIQINLRIENWKNNRINECSFKANARLGIAKVGVSSLRRLQGSDKLVLVWYDEFVGGSDHRSRIELIDLANCREENLLYGLLSDPIVIPSTDGGFHVFLESQKYCSSFYGRCIITYDSNVNIVNKKAFNVYSKWSSLHVEKLSNGNFLARGWKDHETYQIVMIDRLTNRNEELMKLVRADPRLQVVSSDLSVCWVANPNAESIVRCSQFDENGRLIFTKDTRFNEAVEPIAVRTISDGDIFLLVGKTHCYSEQDCWTLKWAIVSQFPVRSYALLKDMGVEKFNCDTGDRKRLVINDFWRSGETGIHYGYTCRHENRYSYKVNTFYVYYNENDPKRPYYACFKTKDGAVICR